MCGELSSSSYVVGSFNSRKVVAYADLVDGVSKLPVVFKICVP